MDDILKVRNYPERTLVDLLGDERDESYLVFDGEGCSIRLGMERVLLDWKSVHQLRELMKTAEKVWGSS